MKPMTNLSFFCDLRDGAMAVYEDVTGSWDAKRTKVCEGLNSVYIQMARMLKKCEEGRKATRPAPLKNALGSKI
jgi:hypothetical protein